MQKSSQPNEHLPGLNGLRALAVVAVILSHMFFETKNIYVLKFFSGNWGVTLFFVISGFLITTLLLREFEAIGRVDIKSFYFRRAVRILPPAYFFLFSVFILTLLDVINVSPASLISAALFLKNLPIPGVPHEWHLGHFWSLAVEEQYYLMLPILLLIARKHLPIICLLMIMFSLVVTYSYFHLYKNNFSLRIVMALFISQVPLFIGTLFALWNFRDPDLKQRISPPLTILCICLSMFSLSSENNMLPNLLKPLFSAAFAGAAIFGVINTAGGILGWLLNNAASDFMGRISYGLYLWQQLFTHESIIRPSLLGGYALPLNALAILVCALGSYYTIEKPLLKMRARFRNRSLD